MVSTVAVNAALHRIDQEATLNRGLSHPSAEIYFWTKRSFCRLVRNELSCPEQADAPDIADRFLVTQSFESRFEERGWRSGATGIGAMPAALSFVFNAVSSGPLIAFQRASTAAKSRLPTVGSIRPKRTTQRYVRLNPSREYAAVTSMPAASVPGARGRPTQSDGTREIRQVKSQ